jgi:hypothetical protein
MRDGYDDRGITYIGPRALIVGVGLYCAGFLALVYGANRIGESYEAREPVTVPVSTPVAPAESVARGAAPPAHLAAQTSSPARAGVMKPKAKRAAMPAVVPPAVPPPIRPNVRMIQPQVQPPVRLEPAAVVRAPIRSVPVVPWAPAAAAALRAAHRRPVAVPDRPVAPASRTPAALLVPFKSASGLTSSGGLDPRAGEHARLVVGPTKGLGPNPSATPFGGPEGPPQR